MCSEVYGDEEQFQPIMEMSNQAKSIGDFRNTLVHAVWAVDENGIANAVRFSARGKFKRSKFPVTPAEILERANEALELAGRLAEFRDALLQNHASEIL
jgi:hypothetical protein